MQFKHPEILYALFLLLIPIIVHLFQLRKFQKVTFTNVAFLKEATQQTRKSKQLKKWLLLLTRLLLLASLVLAFAQPFTSKTNAFKTEKETVIYLDNSFSMQAKGVKGELLKRAVQDLIVNIPENDNITFFTNNSSYKNTTIKAIKNDLLQLEYSASPTNIDAVILKGKSNFSKKTNTIKNFIAISDFQNSDLNLKEQNDTLTQLHLVKLSPVNIDNITIDSAFISKSSVNNIELKVVLKNSGKPVENFPISLFNNDKLIAKTSISINKQAETLFSLPANEPINGKIEIDDANLDFDNTLFFNINNTKKINVLTINGDDDNFLKRIFTNNEFNYTSTPENALNYNILEDQNLIILNELNNIPVSLTASLKQFTSQGGSLIIIPSTNPDISAYNSFLNAFQFNFANFASSEKQITTINYEHPLFNNGVFEKQVSNFQYPKVNSFYNISSTGIAPVLQFEDKSLFLGQKQSIYVFASAFNSKNSNFKNSPLIVPTLYNIAKQSFKSSQLYYEIGKENTFDIDTKLQQDEVITLVKNDINIIPKQQYFNSKVAVTTDENPEVSDTYAVKQKNETIDYISFNYNRKESILLYPNLSTVKNINYSDSINNIFNSIKSSTNVNALWKWFVIFALALLLIEMLILKYFK
ncbi:BatA domain-containing protein [Neotamlana laminarinivorans]|uniref:BatA domain-containing protein n=1 Tax=Neotamlana laminarinivorans TaxID=2883124 RepID=A0A9X1L2T5_9FLAO|nr:BatA domain-containing protein [Tamlana laminarinivorans]MCB4797532.1 BatA domain-containing protein [Tamlana laminarinivorans]